MKYAAHASLLLMFVSMVGAARAQTELQQTQLRAVRGTVFDKSENPIASAVVYLKNTRTLTVRTYISDNNGEYHFSGLDPNVDYQIHAEHDKLTSGNHTISSLDSRKEIVLSLKLDKEKKGEK
jgi:protocatechuate 3,4-dioxygenase beta subunit